MIFSTSRELIKNVSHFLEIRQCLFWTHKNGGQFYGWGRRNSGLKAVKLADKYNGKFVLLEDGFIRSIGLGSQQSPSFSIIEDDVGIYYDATQPSKLENILNSYEFDENILNEAGLAIERIKKYNISKYNCSKEAGADFFPNNGKKRVLIISQTKDDKSVAYGLGNYISTINLIYTAYKENKDADIYLKIHPEALKGSKKSDILKRNIPPFCKVIEDDINPISLLKLIDKVYTKTSQMGFDALILGKECVCFGLPFYAGWGVSDDRAVCKRRVKKRTVLEIFAAAYILYTRYFDPYNRRDLTLLETIDEIAKIKSENRHKNGFFFGFSRWKHNFIKPFFAKEQFANLKFINPLFGSNHLKIAQKLGLDENSLIYIWGKKPFTEVKEFAKQKSIPTFCVEDGFIRSIDLGSDLTKPYSLVVDRYGIYFDATNKSELEEILNKTVFDKDVLKTAEKVMEFLVKNHISKYNIDKDRVIKINADKKIIFVPGQVDDDASIIYGSQGMSNIELLKKVREANINSFIIYKPHPDVIVKNRIGKLNEKKILLYADAVIKNISPDSLFKVCDEVHTITSLTGFEALLRGKKVVTYGMPFYAGWGLTRDNLTNSRRVRKLTLQELVAGVLIVYPRYIHPKTDKLCNIMIFLKSLNEEKMRYNAVGKNRKGELLRFVVRKAQMLYRIFKQ
ncbi:MAG: capsular polysaccharide biosynthesis protein [Campylobacteraceae bacterium]|jgi:capsular polysaccharide export protein|nr:capsular polysaccharide biosynthesis protein [Campylobacteraceae bacterium]